VVQIDYQTVNDVCNMWRNTVDIEDSWTSISFIMDYFIDNQERFFPFAGPGRWHDPDALLLGNYGLSYDQSKVQFVVWTQLAAPLLISTDLKAIDPEIKAILLNRDIIAINQDPLGIMGRVVNMATRKRKQMDVWVRPVTPIINTQHSYSVAYVSRDTYGVPQPLSVTLAFLGLTNPSGYTVKDLFNPSKTFTFLQTDTIEELINPCGVNFYKFTPIA
jgi:Alpha galactosidase A/Alpha galactosidase A C-terminal beta sandwich domain